MKKSKWTKKPMKKGWYWIRNSGSTEVIAAGYFDKQRRLFTFLYEDTALERLWNCRFHPVTPPK